MSDSVEEGSKSAGPLAGIKVIEMGTLIAGPFGGRILAEFGADVIKIETPRVGDPIRNWRVLHEGTSLWWYVQSRNKRCITLDCRSPEGIEVLKSLLREADVLIENFRPGTLDKWGLPASVLQEINPNLIVSRISGFGQTGPHRDRAGFGAIGEALGGIRHLTGYPGEPPPRVGISLGDSIAALYSVIGILMALYERTARGGKGQEVDVALYEAVFSLMESMVPEYDRRKVVRGPSGSVLPGIAPSNLYATRDERYVVIAANGDAVVKRLLAAMSRSDLSDDPRFATNATRVENMEFIDGIISSWASANDLSDCLECLNSNGVPASAIYTVEDMFVDPQYRAREMILDMEHPALGRLKVPGIVPKLSRTPGAVRWLGPRLGEHNGEVLGALGLSEDEIRGMVARGTI